MIRPRRSLLFMPGSNARALEKARILPADGIILDLEDSVAPEAKAMARGQIATAIAAGGFGKREVLIRVNPLDSPWWIDDVNMAGKARPDGILVPKISSVKELTAIADRLEMLDGPYSDFSNFNGFGQECTQARDLGFDGKTLIHPGQIEACNAIFTPPAEEVAYARKVIAAFERPENAARGAIQLDGQMVERLHADMARRTIAIADAIATMGN